MISTNPLVFFGMFWAPSCTFCFGRSIGLCFYWFSKYLWYNFRATFFLIFRFWPFWRIINKVRYYYWGSGKLQCVYKDQLLCKSFKGHWHIFFVIFRSSFSNKFTRPYCLGFYWYRKLSIDWVIKSSTALSLYQVIRVQKLVFWSLINSFRENCKIYSKVRSYKICYRLFK